MRHLALSPVPHVLRVLRAFLLAALPLSGIAAAQAQPVVTGHCIGTIGYHTEEVTINVVQLPHGGFAGHMRRVHVYDNGVDPAVRSTVVSGIDDVLVIGTTAYVRCGEYFLALRDGGEGQNAPPDRFTTVRWLGPAGPMTMMATFLEALLGFNGADVAVGQLQVHG